MADTEGARNDLRIAYKFLIDFEKNDYQPDLDQAMRYLRLARQKDSTVSWQHKDEKNKLVTTTPEVLEAIVLHHMATPEILKEDQSPEKLHAAIGLLERAIALRPIPMSYNYLFRAYCKTYQRDKALAIITEANRRYPDDHVIRSNLDYIHGTATVGTEPRKPVNVFAVTLLLGFGFLAFALLTTYYHSAHPEIVDGSPTSYVIALGMMCWFAAIICFIAAYIGRPRMPQDYYDQLNR
jgi:hypothetical protein